MAIRCWNWSEVTSQNGEAPSLNKVRPAGGAATYGNGVGYILGGFQAYGASPGGPFWPLPGLIAYNQSSNTWSNMSSAGFSVYGTSIFGNAEFVPNFGPSGVLIFFGGQDSGPILWNDEAQNFLHFSNISIYDIASETWYWQTATGSVPPDSIMSCTTGVQSGLETFEIFVFGGHNVPESWAAGSAGDNVDNDDFNAVYVLSLPGFVWFKSNDTSAQAKTMHTCELAGNRQMISFCGIDPSEVYAQSFNSTDPWPQGLGIFDMVELQWTGLYDATASPYTPANVVQNWYSQPSSNSSIQWNSQNARALFFPNTSGNSTPPPAGPQVSSSSSSGPPAGTIAGAVIGSLAGFVLLAVVTWLWNRRRQRRKSQPKTTHLPTRQPDMAVDNGVLAEMRASKSIRELPLNAKPMSEMDANRDRPGPHKVGDIHEMGGSARLA